MDLNPDNNAVIYVVKLLMHDSNKTYDAWLRTFAVVILNKSTFLFCDKTGTKHVNCSTTST